MNDPGSRKTRIPRPSKSLCETFACGLPDLGMMMSSVRRLECIMSEPMMNKARESWGLLKRASPGARLFLVKSSLRM